MSLIPRQRVLVVDDERINRKLLSNLLEEQHDVVLAKNGVQALERLADGLIDLILLDVIMPEMNGYEVLRQIKENEKFKEIPVIFISALDKVDDEEKGLALGAADYISKPFHPSIVKLRVENHLRFNHQRKLLEILAGRDGLTELNNRRSFNRILDSEWRRAKRRGALLSLVMVDVDFFKPYNDNYGHASGDNVLRSLANVFSSSLQRASDCSARYGGEEFVLLLPDTKAEAGRALAEKIRKAVEALQIPHDHSKAAPHITISMGGATVSCSTGLPQELLEQADKMLYEAKARGRNCVCWLE